MEASLTQKLDRTRNSRLFTGQDPAGGSGQEVKREPAGRVGSSQEELEISRISCGAGQKAFTYHGSGRGHPDPI